MKKRWIILIVVIVVLLAFRLYLPYLVKDVVNDKLSDLEEYEASITDVDISLIRGVYSIDSLSVLLKGDSVLVPFVFVNKINMAVEWSALFKGKIVGRILLDQPEVNFAKVDEEVIQDGKGVSWVQEVKDLMPIRINSFEIKNGYMAYKDFTTDPNIDVWIDEFNLLVTNLTNIENSQDSLPSYVKGSAVTFGDGSLNIEAKMNALKEVPDVDLNFEIEDVNIVEFNNFLRTYAGIDAEKGSFNLYTEVIVNDGAITGYVKPIMEDLEILEWEEEEGGFISKVWESIVGGVTEVFENQPKDQFATRAELQGNVNDVETEPWPAVWNVFKNAFIDAFSKGIENTIGLESELGKN
jgi:hypothetical protein